MRVIVPFAPGGVVDVMGRMLTQKLSEQIGMNFYIVILGGRRQHRKRQGGFIAERWLHDPAVPLVKSNSLKALAVTGCTRVEALPNVPTSLNKA